MEPGLAVTLNGVLFDECNESNGTMIETKGPRFAYLLRFSSIEANLVKDWTDQATRQVDASGGRAIEWYFAEQAAADKARKIFNDNYDLRGKITVFTVPAEVP
ncbi:MAG: hypothetical protein ACREDT_07400 [Methylocella sp.]